MKISVITPSYNQGRFIQRTLESVAMQARTYFEIEHVVFDGGSTDTTVEILRNFESLTLWVSESDKGQTDAVNRGINATNGEIIGWLNSDDVYYPGALQLVAEYFSNNPDIDVVYGMADHIDMNDHAFEAYPTEEWDFERLKETCFICQPALFFRRRLVVQYGLLDETLNYCMDYEYWLRLGKAGVRFAYLEVKLAGSRLYADNKTLGAPTKVHTEINDMFKKFCGKVPDRWLYNYAHAVLREQPFSSRIFPEKVYLCLQSLWAAIRWNYGVSRRMLVQLRLWIR